MTSEVFWNSGISPEEDLCFQDTFLMMSSADFQTPPLQEDLDPCRVNIMTAPRSVDRPTEAQSIAGGNEGSQNDPGENANVNPDAGGASAAGSNAGAGAGAGGGGDNHDSGNEGGEQAPVEEDESHELHGTSSSSAGSGSIPVLIPPASMPVPPQAVPWVSTPSPTEHHNRGRQNGNHSEGSGGISDATTAIVSDTEGHGQIIVSLANDPGPSTSKQSTSSINAMTSNVASCSMEISKTAPDNLSVSTVSTLSSYTISGSSGKEDKKSSSSSDISFHLDTSKLGTSTISEHSGLLLDVPQQPVFEERVAEFHLSQEDMFAEERYTSTPSETIEILGFSQPARNENLGDDSNLIIPPSPDAFEAVPFLYPGTPSEDPGKLTLKRSMPREFTLNDDITPGKKTANEERSSTSAVMLPQSHKKPSQKRLAEAKISRFIASRMDPQTSRDCIPEENEAASSPQVSENVACKIVFESQTSDSQEGSSDPSNRKHAIRPSNTPLFKPINKGAISDSTSTDSNADASVERPSTENLILSQLMENIANLESPAIDSQQTDTSAKPASSNLYVMKPKEGPSLISVGETTTVKSPVNILLLESAVPQTDKNPSLDSLKETETIQIDDSCKEQHESEELQSDDELFLHYSPSQRMESQYFPMEDEIPSGEVAESDLDSEYSACEAKLKRTKEQLEPEIVPESETFEGENEPTNPDQPTVSSVSGVLKQKLQGGISSFKTCLDIEDTNSSVTELTSKEQVQQPSFHLPASQAIVSLETEIPEEEKGDIEDKHESEERVDIAGPSGVEKQSKPSLVAEKMSEECNPFDSTSDEFDAPVCPVGRHKRPNVWTDNIDVPESELQLTKKLKTQTKSSSCQVDIINKPSSTVMSRDQAVQTVHAVESKAITQIVSEACDTTDCTDIIRRTTIVTRTVIAERLRHGKVIKKTVVETNDEPVISEFPYDDNEARDPLFTQPTPTEPSPESSIIKSGTSSLNKSNSSSSHASGWLGDISSSKSSSSSSSNKTPMPSRLISSGDSASLINRASTPLEAKSVSGMKTLRSVKRRQFYEFKKTLNLSSPETVSPVKGPKGFSPPDSDHNDSKSLSEIPKVNSPAKKSNKRRKKVVQALTVAAEAALPASPVKRPGKGKKRGKQSPSISPRQTTKDDHSKRPSRNKTDISHPSTSREVDVPTSTGFQKVSGFLQPGARVMAKWQDKFYYPGRILQQEKDDSWLIMYDDGDARSIKVGKILAVDVLPVGQSVYAESADGEFDSGIILENFTKDGETVYKVEIDGGTVKDVPRSKVCLTHDQAALLEELPTNTMYGYTSICLDNIVEGKRRSRGESREALSPSTQRSPRTQRQAKKPFTKTESPDEGGQSSSDEVDQSSGSKHSAKNLKRPK